MKVFVAALLYTALTLGANAADLADLRQGDMRKLVLHPEPRTVPDIPFVDAEGAEHRLSDHAGKVLVVNFWATWCAPCRKEMPMLDAIEADLGGADLAVLPIATGRNTERGVTAFFEEAGVSHLPLLFDAPMLLARNMAVLGLPVTVLIDREGREVGRLIGEADWAAPEARALLAAMMAL